jgi:hypothetical protein
LRRIGARREAQCSAKKLVQRYGFHGTRITNASKLRQFCCGKVGVLVIDHLGEVGVRAQKPLLDENWYPLFGIMLYLTT